LAGAPPQTPLGELTALTSVNLDKQKWRDPDHGERGARAYNGVWGQSPLRAPVAEPLVRGGQCPPEAESFLRIGHSKEGANGPMSVFFK